MESIEIEIKEAQSDFQKFERIHTYFVNEYQEMMYHTIKAGTYHPILKTNASIIGLRVGSNCDENLFRLAFNAIGKIDRFLKAMALLRTVYKPYFLVSIRTTSNYLKHLKSAYKLF